MSFKKELQIPVYNCDANYTMRLSAAVQVMQQAGTDHLNSIGISHQKLWEDGMVFLLAKTCIKVHRMPMGDEIVTVITCPCKGKGARFNRDVVIEDTEGNPLLSFVTIWMLVDPISHKIHRPTVFPYDLPYEETIAGAVVVEEKFPKIGDQPPDFIRQIPVVYSHIDNNGHVNNSVYIDFICDTLPYEEITTKGIDSLTIAYKSEALPGDMIELSGYRTEDGSVYFRGTKEGEDCFEVLLRLQIKE